MRVEAANTGRPGIGSGAPEGPSAPAGRDQGLWKNRHASVFSAGRMAVARLGNGWRLLLGVGVGILVAVVLISTVPLYDSLMTNVQLQATLNGEGAAARNVEIVASTSSFTAQIRDGADSRVHATGGRYLGSFTAAAPTMYLQADPMLLSSINTKAYNVSAANATEVTYSAYEYAVAGPHMHLVAGALPQAGGAMPQAVITQQMAANEKVGIGDKIQAVAFGAHDKMISVQVVGIWAPNSTSDPFWNERSFDAGGSDNSPLIYPVLMDSQSFTAATSAIASLSVGQHWIYYTTATRIDTTNMADVQNDVGLLRAHLLSDLIPLGDQVSVNTALDKNITAVQQQLSLLTLPLYVVVALVVGLALLFVLAMAGLLVDGQTVDIATLKSRGASGVQLLGSYATQGLLLGIAAALIGPWLAGLLAVSLVRAFVPAATLSSAGASSSYLLGLATPRAVAVPAIAGALLGVGAVVFATQQAARMDVLAFRREQGRSTRQPLWRRYYLDLGLAVLCALGYFELGSYGSLGTRSALGQGSSPLLLAAPALLLLAGTLLLLRVFPLVAALGARWASGSRGATGMLAFSQVARNPAGPSRLMLLLALAVGLGLFALTFDASLVRNAADRASYQAGADLRLVEHGAQGTRQDPTNLHVLQGLPGVVAATGVYRGQATTTFDEGYSTVGLLGVDPATWEAAAGQTSWRGDYASTSITSLMHGLQSHQIGASDQDRPGHTQAGDQTHPLWAIVSDTFAAPLHLNVGDRFALSMPGSSNQTTLLTVGAIVHDFPTLYPTAQPGGFVVLNLNDCIGAISVASQGAAPDTGPNEYWVHSRDMSATLHAVNQAEAAINLDHVIDRAALEATIASNPIQAGMRGLLLVGALTAAALAVLGTVVQSAMAARQRVVQFAVLRTMGMTSGQLSQLLLSEQVMVYFVGLVGGTVLGAVLATATLPFLQFGDTTLDPTTLGIPPYVLAIDPHALLWFYAVLVVAFAVALVIAARYAARLGLGKTLRLGED